MPRNSLLRAIGLIPVALLLVGCVSPTPGVVTVVVTATPESASSSVLTASPQATSRPIDTPTTQPQATPAPVSPTATRLSADTPVPTVAAPPLGLENVHTVQLEVVQSYPQLEGTFSQPITKTVEHILEGLGYQVVQSPTESDAILAITLAGKAEKHISTTDSKFFCYNAASQTPPVKPGVSDYFDNVTFTDPADCVAGICVNAFGYPGDCRQRRLALPTNHNGVALNMLWLRHRLDAIAWS
jgi:hypothetical protein